MVGVPAAIPVTTPEVLTEPSPMLLLLQVPVPGVEPSAVVKPTHTDGVPVIAVGNGLTVTIMVVVQPVTGNV